jgi:hypothetical protein
MDQIMRPLLFIMASALLPHTAGSQIAGRGENAPTVQSAFGGSHYVRSIPSDAFGTSGKTQVFRVRSSGDELLDEYPVYMLGELHLGWSPIVGKWSVVHLEPARVSSDIDANIGRVTRLAFHSGGKEILSYSAEQLRALGLERRVTHLRNNLNGSFTVHGIEQIAGTNTYVFVIEKTVDNSSSTERISLDITTGRAVRR